jgi:hypothetical protein
MSEEAKERKLGMIVRVFKGLARGGRGGGDKSKEKDTSQIKKAVHIGYFENRGHFTKDKVKQDLWKEVENLAEFEGSTSEDAAKEFLKLFFGGATLATSARCKADGRAPSIALWSTRHGLIRFLEKPTI